MMNRKGLEGGQIGALLVLAIALIVGLVLLQQAAQNVGSVTNTISITNQSLTTAVNGTAQYLTNVKSISGVTVLNGTVGLPVAAGNYTIENNVVYNGQEAVKITPDTSAEYKHIWKISATSAQPTTYDPSSGGRAVAGLIVIFGAIALVGACLLIVMKSDVFNF